MSLTSVGMIKGLQMKFLITLWLVHAALIASEHAGIYHPEEAFASANSFVNSGKHRSNRVMKIQFKRSGGFSPMTNVTGEVQFNDESAEVTSPGGTYRRTLSAEERTELRE